MEIGRVSSTCHASFWATPYDTGYAVLSLRSSYGTGVDFEGIESNREALFDVSRFRITVRNIRNPYQSS